MLLGCNIVRCEANIDFQYEGARVQSLVVEFEINLML